MSSFNNASSQIYEGTAELGKVQSSIGLIFGCLISLIFIGVAIYLFTVDQNSLVNGVATVLAAECNQSYDDKNRVTQICNLTIKYDVKGQSYTGNISTESSKVYNVGNIIDITYDSNNPTDVSIQKMRSKTIGIIMSVIGVIIGGAAFMNYYFTSRYKSYAALQGTTSALSVLSSPFRN